ncbi:MAG: hypothetical protein PVH61_28580 [Candidatus Aminicenantes bacterium]
MTFKTVATPGGPSQTVILQDRYPLESPGGQVSGGDDLSSDKKVVPHYKGETAA